MKIKENHITQEIGIIKLKINENYNDYESNFLIGFYFSYFAQESQTRDPLEVIKEIKSEIESNIEKKQKRSA